MALGLRLKKRLRIGRKSKGDSMLTNRQIENIKNFDRLKSNHRRVLRYFLRKKCEKALKHLNFLLLNYQNLHIRPTDIINLQDLNDLIKNLKKIEEKEFYDKIRPL